MLPSLQMFIAVLLSAVAYGCFGSLRITAVARRSLPYWLQWQGCLPQLPLRFSSQ
jgi:hypothetical protein